MTPKPDNLPAPADMTLQQLLFEMARVLHNAGGEAHGAGYSAKLADAAIARADNLPGWRPIETAPRDDLIDILIDGGQRWASCYYDRICDEWRTSRPSNKLAWVKAICVTHWYDFGGGSPTPPAPEAKP